MRRSFVFFFAALVFALALTLSSPLGTRTAHSGDIHERCEDCNRKNFERFEQCTQKYGEVDPYCYDRYNEGVVHCYKNFCEQ